MRDLNPTNSPAVSIFSPSAPDIRYEMENSEIRYPPNNPLWNDYYRHVAVFPELYSFLLSAQRVPAPDECAAYLLNKFYYDSLVRGAQSELEGVLGRTHKLVLDWFRDLLLSALLVDRFGSCFYETVNDKGFNVDFVVRLKPFIKGLEYVQPTDIGICAAMMSRPQWDRLGSDWLTRKMESKQKRGYEKWPGDSFAVSNRATPHSEEINGVWLYGSQHVDQLLKDVQVFYKPHQEGFV